MNKYKTLILDVGYSDTRAKVIGALINKTPEVAFFSKYVEKVEPYVSGEFYKRELPCLLSLITELRKEELELIIIDGYVYIGEDKKLGLGAYLYNALEKKIPIIGVAKRFYKGNDRVSEELIRGQSKNPLYISSVGIELSEAVQIIANMEGDYRIPHILKEVDRLTKED